MKKLLIYFSVLTIFAVMVLFSNCISGDAQPASDCAEKAILNNAPTTRDEVGQKVQLNFELDNEQYQLVHVNMSGGQYTILAQCGNLRNCQVSSIRFMLYNYEGHNYYIEHADQPTMMDNGQLAFNLSIAEREVYSEEQEVTLPVEVKIENPLHYIKKGDIFHTMPMMSDGGGRQSAAQVWAYGHICTIKAR